MHTENTESLFSLSHSCLMATNVEDKLVCTQRLFECWQKTELTRETPVAAVSIDIPGRPERPALVAPRDLPRRRLATQEGHAVLIHSLCHIEFNAINLALDAVYRFRDMPEAYYHDWLKVTAEEAHYFALLRDHLGTLGHAYGDFPAHNGL